MTWFLSWQRTLQTLKGVFFVPSAVEMISLETGGPTWLWCSPMRQKTLQFGRRPSPPWETLWVQTHPLPDWWAVTHMQTDARCGSSPHSLQRPHTRCSRVLPDCRPSLWGVHPEGREAGSSEQQPQVRFKTSCHSPVNTLQLTTLRQVP